MNEEKTGLPKFEKELDLLQAQLSESETRTKGMKAQIRHQKLVGFMLCIECVLLVIIAYGLLK